MWATIPQLSLCSPRYNQQSTYEKGVQHQARPHEAARKERRLQKNRKIALRSGRNRRKQQAKESEAKRLSIYLLFYYKAGQPLGESAMPPRLAMRMMMLRLMVFDDDDGDEKGLFLVII